VRLREKRHKTDLSITHPFPEWEITEGQSVFVPEPQSNLHLISGPR
jgi:hypothetical protein